MNENRKSGRLGRNRDLVALTAIALAIRLSMAALIASPGYMDAAYYAGGAVRLAGGQGFSEGIVWNYLDKPAQIPHPGFLYWMPLPAILGAPFAALSPGSFFAIQLPFVMLASMLPAMAYCVGHGIDGDRRTARLAGLLTLFSGFYFPYWTLPETFAPFAVFGSAALWVAGRRPSSGSGARARSNARSVLCGVLVGLAQLTRSDGVLLLPFVVAGLAVDARATRSDGNSPRWRTALLANLVLVVAGYLVMLLPWLFRNARAAGTPLPPWGTQTCWLRTYDDLFCYECDLSWHSYLAWGWENILRSKLWALGTNLQRFLAEHCMVALLPLVLAGFYVLRRSVTFALAGLYLVAVFLAHSLAFTFPGPRGGFFHASSPVLVFLFAAAAHGLREAVQWGSRRRRWNPVSAYRVFCGALVVLSLVLSSSAAVTRLRDWRAAARTYEALDEVLETMHVQRSDVIMVGDPPTSSYHSARPAVVVPNGEAEDVLAVAEQYGVSYLVLDRNRPQPLASLYDGSEGHPRIRGLKSVPKLFRVYRILAPDA
jgi:hypothetical protein